jgi:outer membrane protein
MGRRSRNPMTCVLRPNAFVAVLVLWVPAASHGQTNLSAVRVPVGIDVAGQPQERTVPLTLDDAVTLALERNLDIAVQRRNPELQDIQVLAARSVYSPTITSALSSASQTTAPTSQLQVSSGGGGVRTETYAYNGAFSKLFATGGTFSATLNKGRQVSTSNNVFYNPQFTSTWSFNFAQPLLRGLGIDAQRRALTVAQINRQISDLQLRAVITNTVSNVRNAYWDLVFAVQAVEVARESVSLAATLVRDNQVRVDVGTLAPLDVVQAQAEQASRQQALVTAEGTRRTSELALKRLIVGNRNDANWDVTLVPVDRPEFMAEVVELEAAVRQALENRTDINAARTTVRANATTLRFLRNATLPDINLAVMYGTQGVGGPYLIRSDSAVLGSTVTETVPGGIGDAFGSLFAVENPRWSFGVNVTVPIGTTAQDAALARGRVQLSQIEAQLAQVELQIVTEVTSAAIQLRNAVEAVQAAQASRGLMQQRAEAEQAKFGVGMSTNYFVVLAQRDLSDARNSELRATLNYRKALVEFERVQQTTLQSASITILQP